MTEWNDDKLSTLLRETFASREELADPAAARQIAATPRRQRRWLPVIAAAAAVLAAVGLTVQLTRGGEPGAPDGQLPTTSPTPSPPERTLAENRAAAAQESRRVIGIVPLIGDATRIPSKPVGWPEGSMSIGGDPRLSKVAWYSFPASADAVETFLIEHPPAGLVEDDFEAGESHPGVGGGSDGVHFLSYSPAQTRKLTDAHPGASLLVQWKAIGNQTFVQFSTAISYRYPRPENTLVSGAVTSVEVDRVRRRNSMHNVVLPRLTVTSGGQIGRLVAAVNALPGSTTTGSGAFGCPYPGNPRPHTTLTFHTTEGVISFAWDDSCFEQIQVSRDGDELTPTLDPSNLPTLVDTIVDGS
jgi:hypothetical protein